MLHVNTPGGRVGASVYYSVPLASIPLSCLSTILKSEKGTEPTLLAEVVTTQTSLPRARVTDQPRVRL